MAVAANTYRNYIDGAWVDSESGEQFEDTNPATGEVIGSFPRSTTADTDRAVAAAHEAYASWRLYPAPQRGGVLFQVAGLLRGRQPQPTRKMTPEVGQGLGGAGGRRPGGV